MRLNKLVEKIVEELDGDELNTIFALDTARGRAALAREIIRAASDEFMARQCQWMRLVERRDPEDQLGLISEP